MVEQKDAVEVQEQSKDTWEAALERESWVAPLVDIYETEDVFLMVANMPGVSKDDVKVKLEDGSLIIMGRINFDEVNSYKYILKESETSNYYRKFKISDSVDESKIDAKFDNGQLHVTLPKHERVKPKTIEIN
ncbi:MAG: Hsp20/alpha crystallin family protein [Melioribacteraceae bacterium]|nr:Hsp20/alpha crystallin family protein [Melioribacteraceae bacterium]MCF8263642.1 Hsp20/alpha crystallin family protein [Melioribacteraceae bacterium]MCF8412051.1 Hsp20/alpha crystallin family protein [Melioribacteraceae bacterium]MCF8431428.1 Hsp20/alpha crystallin family protein [Melioribacteraceae bacterium]